MRTPIADGDNATMTTMIGLTASLATGGTGTAQGTNFVTDCYGASEWAAWSSLYQEFRVLAYEWKYVPQFSDGYVTGGVLTPAQGAIATYHQNSGFTAPTTIAEMICNRTYKEFNLARPMTIHWRMSGADEAGFLRTDTAPPQVGCVHYLAEGGTASSLFGRVYVRTLVQFKGRK